VHFSIPFGHPVLSWQGGWIFGFFSNLKIKEKIMTQDWLTVFTQSHADSAPSRTPQAKVRVILLGTPEDVSSVIYELYQRGFAEVSAWSPPQMIPDADEIIRVHIRRFGRSSSPG
jgi:hypothetical protein